VKDWGKENISLRCNKCVASLDVLVRLLADPDWGKKAKKVKTLRGMRQILFDFCKANGKVIQIDKDTVYIYI